MIWAGWNYFALLLIPIGVVSGGIADFVGQHLRLRSHIHSAMVALTIGITVVAADIIFRIRSTESTGLSRVASHRAGATILFFPGWFVGLWIVGTAIAMFTGRA